MNPWLEHIKKNATGYMCCGSCRGLECDEKGYCTNLVSDDCGREYKCGVKHTRSRGLPSSEQTLRLLEIAELAEKLIEAYDNSCGCDYPDVVKKIKEKLKE